MQNDYNPDHEGRCGPPVLLDVTRLVALRWSRRRPSGIDRVCLAYLRRLGPRARAVVQYRGAILVTDGSASCALLGHLLDSGSGHSRGKTVAHLANALASRRRPATGSVYLNVGHTDFDLPVHSRWVERHRLRAVYLVHDLIPVLHPQHCRPHAIVRHTGRVVAALQQASGIIVGSIAVARDLRNFADECRLVPPPVAVAPLAGGELRSDLQRPAGHDDYFLCVGTIESRKNHILLLKVWDRIRARLGAAAPRLVIVGRWGTGVAALREVLARSKMAGGLIEIIDDCGDEALATLMQGARAMLMPSLAEGFGLPMAEALALGVPVIASDLPCFHEVGQGIPSLLDPHDVGAWEARVLALDADAARRQRRIDALRGYQPTTWAGHFARVEPWLDTVATAPVRTPTAPGHPAPAPFRGSDACRYLSAGN